MSLFNKYFPERKENKAENERERSHSILKFRKMGISAYKIDVKYSVKCFKTVGEKPTYSVKEI